MSAKPFDPASYLEQAAALLGLELKESYKPAIVENLAGAAAVARLFLEFPLADDVEAGPVFRP